MPFLVLFLTVLKSMSRNLIVARRHGLGAGGGGVQGGGGRTDKARDRQSSRKKAAA